MSRIFVEFNGMQQLGGSFNAIAAQVDSIQSGYKNAVNRLDWNVRFQSDIDATAARLSHRLGLYKQTLSEYEAFLNEAYGKYKALDVWGEGGTSQIALPLILGPIMIGVTVGLVTWIVIQNNLKVDMDKAIADYETAHPDDARRLNGFLATGDASSTLTEDDIRNIKYRVYSAEEPYRSIYLNTIEKFEIDTVRGGGVSQYSPWNQKVTYTYPDDFANDPRDPYTVYFHECGHAIDDLSDRTNKRGSDTENLLVHSDAMGKDVTVREAILYDVYENRDNPHSVASVADRLKSSRSYLAEGDTDRVIDAFEKGSGTKSLSNADKNLYNAVKSEMAKGIKSDPSHYESVSDVYGAVSHNALRGDGYGHAYDKYGNFYWDDKSMAAKELWAEYFSYNMSGSDENLAHLREYFPEASKVLDAYAYSLVK